jgi:hypothetical protein
MAAGDAGAHAPDMTLGFGAARHLLLRSGASARPHGLADMAVWAAFAIAAVVFALDATTTIAVIGLRPDAVEQNPIARWTLSAHPAAPYLLKAAVIAECAVACALARSMGERWAAWAVIALMTLTGVLGIASGVAALLA